MNAVIEGLGNQPQGVLLFLAGFFFLPMLICSALLRAKRYSLGWLALAIVPIIGWVLVCVLLLLPGRPQPIEETFAPRTAGVSWDVLAVMFFILAMFTGVSWVSRTSPPPLPGLKEGQVRSNIINLVESSSWFQQFETLGPPEIVQIEDLGYDQASGHRVGRAIVKHNLGKDIFRVELYWADDTHREYMTKVELDKSEMLSPTSWQVRQRLEDELARLPEVRELGLSTDQLKALPVAETSTDRTQPMRAAEVGLPMAAGQPPRNLKFLVHWCDQAESCPGIQLIQSELPPMESASFQHELKHAVEDWPQFRENYDTYGRPKCEQIEPLLFDAEQQQRFYRVHVRHTQGELQLSVVNQWKNREQGLWEVKVLEP